VIVEVRRSRVLLEGGCGHTNKSTTTKYFYDNYSDAPCAVGNSCAGVEELVPLPGGVMVTVAPTSNGEGAATIDSTRFR
jgi:hypothetical protein